VASSLQLGLRLSRGWILLIGSATTGYHCFHRRVLYFALAVWCNGVSSETHHGRIAFFLNLAVIAAIVGGAAALSTAILRSLSVVVTDAPCGGPSGFNCSASGDFRLPGNPSGFWDLWASDELSILKSIFAW
jgi:hypothetical protein